jgi:hypothetical protein
MDLAVIIAALLAAAAGLVVLAAFAWRWAASHRRDLLAAGMHGADRLHMQWLPGTCQTPAWIFSTSVVLGLIVIASAAVGRSILVEDVTAGDGIAVLGHPVDQLRLTGAVGTQEASEPARPGRERAPVQGRHGTEPLSRLIEAEHPHRLLIRT